MEALVSIITPCYNSEKYIEETYESIRAQTYENWEWIVVDDGSIDSTVQIVQSFADSRIILIQQENKGPAAARNAGISKAQGQFLTFIDADDLWLPDFISCNLSTTRAMGVFFTCASYRRQSERTRKFIADFIVPEKATYNDILKSNSISCLTAFININKLGKKFMPLIAKRQDMGLWLQYLEIIPHVVGIQKPLAIYRMRSNSVSSAKYKLITHQWNFYRKHMGMNLITSAKFMVSWTIRGLRKYGKTAFFR